MRKSYTPLCCLLILLTSLTFVVQSFAQVNTYSMTPSSGTFTPLTSPTSSSISAAQDNAISTAIPLGFTFYYGGNAYTDVKVAANGFLSFGTTGPNAQSVNNNLAAGNTQFRNSIAGLWDDIRPTVGVTYKITGAAPYRIFTAEWLNMRWDASSPAATPVISFQVILYETTNIIDIVYRQDAGTVVNNSGGATIGLAGIATTDYLSIQSTSAAPATSTSTSVNNLSAKPATGQVYRFNPQVATPPAPVQDPAAPTCATGASLSVSGTPGSNEQWYWQTSAAGTSMANPVSGPYAVYVNGTYYARAYNTVTLQWSYSSSPVTVSNVPSATPPPAPVAAQNPTCVTTGTTLSVADPAAGFQYFWQGTNPIGVSTSTPASSSQMYPVTSAGMYYVSAYETATQCWSAGTGVSVAFDSFIPSTPTAATTSYNICSGTMSLPVSTNPQPASSTLTYVFGTNIISDGVSPVILPVTIPALPAGATITSAQIQFTNVNAIDPSYRSEILVALSGMFTLNQTQISNQDSPGAITPDPVINLVGFPLTGGTLNLILSEDFDDEDVDDASFANAQIVINYSVPVSVVNWYDASTGGNNLGSGNPFETVGTSVLPDTDDAGPYVFYAGSVSGGCQSAGRIAITVNVTEILASLIAVPVSCNGGNDGTFTLGTVQCGGSGPFQYSIDGGTFGDIPDDLSAGTYSVVMQSGSLMSAPIEVVIAEPDVPQNLAVNNITYYTAEISWDAQGNETDWTVIYGPVGFNPVTEGTTFTATNPDTLTGLDASTSYEFYVYANCGFEPALAGPESFSTNSGFLVVDNTCGPGFMDISGSGDLADFSADIPSEFNEDDAEAGVTLPFTFNYQGMPINEISIGYNGGIALGTLTGEVEYDIAASDSPGLFPLSMDMDISEIYTQTVGTAPNRQFIIQWTDAVDFFGDGGGATFQVVIDEATSEYWYLYNDVVMDGYNDNGLAGEIGYSGPEDLVLSSYDDAYLLANQCIHFGFELCPNATDLTVLAFEEEAQLEWNAGAYGEMEWTIIYGPEGFDPDALPAQGITQTTTFDYISLGSLEQNTTYDVYIYSECAADNIQSEGLMATFTTQTFCSPVTGITAATDVDSLEAAWNWVLNPDYTTYTIEGFNIQYGVTGFELGSGMGNILSSNGTALNDTVIDADFIAGGVYEVYIQAVCGTVDSVSGWSGPVTFTMPLTNDDACQAEELMTDGTVYTFNNAGGTAAPGETVIAPPATGPQQTDGWINSNLNRTVWYKFTAPASGSVRINATGINYNGQAAVYQVGSCSSFATYNMIAANDNEIGGTSLAPNFTVCGLEDGEEYYLLFDGFNNQAGIYNLAISVIDLDAGTAEPLSEICSGDNIDLFETIDTDDENGMWSSDIAAVNSSIDGSDFETAGLAYNTFMLQYRVTDGCAYDSIMATVQVFGPSNAGQNGNISACRNEPINLLGGLGGNVDHEGTWYDVNDDPITGSEISASNLQGSYSYDYIVSNGVCPADTALVVVNVGSCNFLSLNEEVFNGVEVFPNPSEGIVFISSDISFSYEVTDANGRIITAAANGVKAAQKTEINLNGVERGVYFIRLNNEDAQKTYRIVIR